MRAELHERVAAWLEASLDTQGPEFAEIGGYHLERAYRYRAELDLVGDDNRELAGRAATLLTTAGRRAFRRGDMPASVNLLERAAALLATNDRARLGILNDLGYALFEVGRLERSDVVLTAAIESAARRRRPSRSEATFGCSGIPARSSRRPSPPRRNRRSRC